MKKHINIPIFIPHLACPNDCVFCNQKKIAATEKAPTVNEVKEIIKKAVSTLSLSEEKCEIAFFGGSFTGIDKKQMCGYLEAASSFREYISGIRFSTRPDYISREIMEILKNYPIKTIELGMQSMDDSVLSLCNRGHNNKACKNAVALIKEYGYDVVLQMMTGLPGDTPLGAMNTAKVAAGLNPNGVRIYPCVVVKDTELANMYNRGEYIPQSLEESVSLCTDLLLFFEKENIPVIRMGLFSEQSFIENAIVAGPYHPAFRELCENLIYKRLVEEVISAYKGVKTLEIQVAKGKISAAAGQKNMNKQYFSKEYSINKIVFKENSALNGREFIINPDFA